MKQFRDFVAPRSAQEARAVLRQLGAEGVPVAGATSFIFLQSKEPKVAVDLSRAGLDGIGDGEQAFAVGAMTHITALRTHRAAGWVLDRVAAEFVTQQVRNVSTLGGNIARVFAWADFPAVLLALDAAMTIEGQAARTLPAGEYFNGQPARHFQPGDLLTSIQVPKLAEGQGFGYRKQKRTAADFSHGTAAAWMQRRGRDIAKARVALSASIPLPVRLLEVEAELTGSRGGKELFDMVSKRINDRSWRSVSGFSADYVRHVASVVVRDALVMAWEEAERGGT